MALWYERGVIRAQCVAIAFVLRYWPKADMSLCTAHVCF